MVRVNPGRRGFTLVELLVVIGIIALLISILMPALTKAKNQALMVKCANQERQIYLACQMFGADNKGSLPRPGIGPGDQGPDAERVCMFTMPEWGIVDFTKGVMVQYMPGGPEARKDVWYCPGDLGEVTQGGGPAQSGLKRNFSYSFNAHITQPESGLRKPGIKLSAARNPSRKILIYEEQAPNDLWCLLYDVGPVSGNGPNITGPLPFRGDDIPSARHAGQRYGLINRNTPYNSVDWRRYGPIGKGNFGFFDGHVEVLSPNDLYFNPKSFYIYLPE